MVLPISYSFYSEIPAQDIGGRKSKSNREMFDHQRS